MLRPIFSCLFFSAKILFVENAVDFFFLSALHLILFCFLDDVRGEGVQSENGVSVYVKLTHEVVMHQRMVLVSR